MTFSSFSLSSSILKGINKAGYTSPTEIQANAIPLVLAGKDIIGCSETGSGKTAAFVLPILERLSTGKRESKRRYIRALVLTPTRELALQVDGAIREYGAFTGVQSFPLFGGVDIRQQLRFLRQGLDIVVATPGRLLDHIERRSVDLSKIEALVLDEADRMFDMGFINDVKKIIAQLPTERQTLLFSATMSEEIHQLVKSVQRKPVRIDIGERRNPVETVSHHIFPVKQDMKIDLLFHILENEEIKSVLIFSRTKHGADKITKRLEKQGVQATAIHSNRTQNQRLKALDGFRRGKYKVLVATDIAARGIDVEGISHVINFDTPTFAEDYIHRIGRTGRAGASGDAFTFVSSGEEIFLRRIEKFIGRKFNKSRYPGFSVTKERKENRETTSDFEKRKENRETTSDFEKRKENREMKSDFEKRKDTQAKKASSRWERPKKAARNRKSFIR